MKVTTTPNTNVTTRAVTGSSGTLYDSAGYWNIVWRAITPRGVRKVVVVGAGAEFVGRSTHLRRK